ncbi:MAG: hypothetical protein Fur0034_05870 [Desulfuromonadia bacterium]
MDEPITPGTEEKTEKEERGTGKKGDKEPDESGDHEENPHTPQHHPLRGHGPPSVTRNARAVRFESLPQETSRSPMITQPVTIVTPLRTAG